MDVAFSRDRPEKVYVQNRIWDRRRDLIEWLDGGASFYVCGDGKAMAKDVRATLVRAYADVKGSPRSRRACGRRLGARPALSDRRILRNLPCPFPERGGWLRA